MAKPLRKNEIIAAMSEQTGQTKQEVIMFLDALSELIYQQAENGFVLPGLCKFAVTRRKQGRRYNVATRRHYLVAEHDVLKVIPLKKARLRMAPPPPNLIIGEVPPKPPKVAPTADPSDTAMTPEPAPSVPAPPPSTPQVPPVPEAPMDEGGAVVFECPHCGSSIMAQSEHRGNAGVCPQCVGEIVIPAAGEPKAAKAEATETETASGLFMTFVCDSCGQEIEASLDMVGMKADCPACGSPLKVPKKSESPETSGINELSPESEEKIDKRSMTIRMDLSDFLT